MNNFDKAINKGMETKMNKTEMRNENTKNIHKMSTYSMIETMNKENSTITDAMEKETDSIARAVDAIAEAFQQGGRLIYVGSGTSGRLGMLDAVECPPTFGVDKDQVFGVIAGGKDALTCAYEAVEDNEDLGRRDLINAGVTSEDAVVGISAAGNSEYVIGALQIAKEMGAVTIGLTCNKKCKINSSVDISISPDTGPEVIAGSTRLKAGTAQKMVLNMLSTGAMIKTGKVYENLMINVRPVNKKLRNRCIWIITEITGVDNATAEDALDRSDGNIQKAIEFIQSLEGDSR